MTKHPDTMVCVRIADLPEPHVKSLPRICDHCGWRVWVSINAPATKWILCQPCAAKAIDSSNKLVVTETTLAELLEYRKRILS